MTKKAHLVKAGVLNGHSAESSGALLFVYASPTPSVDKSAELSAYKCGKCNTEFAALAKTEPFCITCGDEDVYEDNEQVLDVEEYEDPDTELASIPCSDCNTKNIVKLTTASVLGAQVHCVTCGSAINFQAPVVAEMDDESGMDDETNDALHDSFEDTLEEDDLTGAEDIEGVDANGDESSDGENAEGGEDLEGADEGEGEPEEANGDESPEGAEGEPSDDAGEPEGSESNDAEGEGDEDEGSEGGEDEDLEEIDFEEETLAKLVGEGSLSLDRVGDVLVASINSLPVATLARSDAAEYANVFHGAEFATAIRHTVKQVGVEKGLSQYGFAFASVKVPVKEIVTKRVTAKVQAEIATLNSRSETLAADFEQAFGIALAALNKNFFKGETNPLKTAFVDMLTTANVRNPARQVDAVFQAHGDAMNRAAFELAKKLLGKSVEHRNEIAASVLDSNYQVIASAEEETDGTSFERRLEGSGMKNVQKKKEQASTVTQKPAATLEVSSVLDRARKLGGGRIFHK